MKTKARTLYLNRARKNKRMRINGSFLIFSPLLAGYDYFVNERD